MRGRGVRERKRAHFVERFLLIAQAGFMNPFVAALMPGTGNRFPESTVRAVQVRAGHSPARLVTAAKTYPPM